jgi:glycerol uptake facilitator-like aquaporin
MTPTRRLAAEGLGTFSLLATVIGSGIMAERLADGNLGAGLTGKHHSHRGDPRGFDHCFCTYFRCPIQPRRLRFAFGCAVR